jgi:hypothetical protein
MAINKYVLHILTLTIFVSKKQIAIIGGGPAAFLLAAFLDPQNLLLQSMKKQNCWSNFSCW